MARHFQGSLLGWLLPVCEFFLCFACEVILKGDVIVFLIKVTEKMTSKLLTGVINGVPSNYLFIASFVYLDAEGMLGFKYDYY